MKKLLAMLLAALLLTSTLTACGDKTDEPEGTVASTAYEEKTGIEITTEGEREPTVKKNDYQDTVYMQVYGEKNMEYLWVKESKNNVVSEALYDRQEKIYAYLGANIVSTVCEGTHVTYHEAFLTSVKNKDGAIDILVTNPYMNIPTMITGGYLRDLTSFKSVNIDEDYWNTEYMEGISLNGKLYLGYGDFNIPRAYVISYNKTIMDQYADSLGESIYDIVDEYRWTVGKMISLANLAYIDKTGDGKTEDDTFGITGQQGIPFVPFLQAANIQLVEQDEKGDYKVSVYNEKNKERMASLVDQIKSLVASDCGWFKYNDVAKPEIGLESNRTLMSLVRTTEIDSYLNYELSFGVVPYPMFDEDQKDVGYRSWNYDGCTVVASYLRNEKMVGDILELLCFYSQPVHTAVFEKLLGKQVADSPDDARMLQLVWDGLCSDIGLSYSHIDMSLDKNLYIFPRLTAEEESYQLASYVASYENSANKALEKFMKMLNKMD